MDPSQLSGSIKAAILVKAMGERHAAGLLNRLTVEERDAVRRHLPQLQSVAPEVVDQVAREFTLLAQRANSGVPALSRPGDGTSSGEGGGDGRVELLVVDQAQSPLSTDLIARLEQSDSVRPKLVTLEQAEKQLSARQASAALIIPANLTLEELKQGSVALEFRQQPNNMNALIASQAISAVIRRVSSAVACWSPTKSSLSGSHFSLRFNSIAMLHRWQELSSR